MNLIFNAVMSNQTSYGIAGINIALALQSLDINLMTIPIGGRADFFPNQNLEKSLLSGHFFDREAPCLRLYQQFALDEHIGRGEFIGWPIFETTKFSEREKHQLKNLDKLIVCSEWAKTIVRQNGIDTTTYVIPLGVDNEIFSPTQSTDDSTFRFFFPGKFEIRKSFEIVMEIFEKAFSANDDIEIYFLPNNFFIGKDNEEWKKFLLSSSLAPKIKIVDRLNTPQDVARLYNYCDCVVSFSKAEGFNMPLLEGLACGKTVVATNYSAHTQFLNSDNSLLVDVDGLEPAIDGVFFNGETGDWALIGEKCKNSLAEACRVAFKSGKKLNRKGVETATQFSWNNTALKILEAL